MDFLNIQVIIVRDGIMDVFPTTKAVNCEIMCSRHLIIEIIHCCMFCCNTVFGTVCVFLNGWILNIGKNNFIGVMKLILA